jgi:hypothetical protein
VHVYYSPKFNRWIARSWPKGNGGDTNKRRWSREAFSNAVQTLKLCGADDQQFAEETAKATPYFKRDILMKMVMGTLIPEMKFANKTYVSARIANMNIQQGLDTISQTTGAMVVRTPDGWVALVPGDDGDILTFDSLSGLPQWQPNTGGGGGGGYPAGTPPTVVQVAHATSSTAATFINPPTAGNLIVAFTFNSNANFVQSGWTKQVENSSGTDWGNICTKVAGTSEPTTQQAMNATANGGVVIYELSKVGGTPQFVGGASQAEQSNKVLSPILQPNIKDCLGISVMSLVGTTVTFGTLMNIGSQDVLDNTGNRRIAAGHSDLSLSPMCGMTGLLSATGSTKGATGIFF